MPPRIVSLVPSTTESVCRLGAGAQLVGCTRYCLHPAGELVGVARIGGTKNPMREAVMALAPGLVLANAEENRPEDLAWLQERVPVLVQTPRDVPGALAALQELAVALEVEGAAAVAGRIVDTVHVALAAADRPATRLRAYYAIWRKPWMTVNRDTFVHDVLMRIGCDNIAATASARYPEMAPSAAVESGVDLVLLPSEPWAFDAAQQAELVAAGTFGGARLLLCDGRDFCWHGVHMAEGLPRAMAALRAVSAGQLSH